MQNVPLIPTVENELTALSKATLDDLRGRWATLFQAAPPTAFGFDLLRRSIAQRLQEDAYGKLPASAQRELNRIVALIEKAPESKLEIPRRIKAGSVLVRDWKGKSHRVMVLDTGFAYDGKTYKSLSEIAREITGTHWNGPRFFGLRPEGKKNSEAGPIKTKRGRPPKLSVGTSSPEQNDDY